MTDDEYKIQMKKIEQLGDILRSLFRIEMGILIMIFLTLVNLYKK